MAEGGPIARPLVHVFAPKTFRAMVGVATAAHHLPAMLAGKVLDLFGKIPPHLIKIAICGPKIKLLNLSYCL